MLTVTDEPAHPYVERGLWAAACPQQWCIGVDWYGPGEFTGRIGGLGDTHFRCPQCGQVAEVAWPALADDIWHVLAQRPFKATRNWSPGETLEDLVVENALHGVGLDAVAAGVRFTDGRLSDRLALAGRTLHAIGG